MKELFKHNKLSERQQIESTVKKKKEVEYKLESSIVPFRGHKVFEINIKTNEVKLAQFVERKNIHWWDAIKCLESGFKKEIQLHKDCVYISAGSKKAAMDRFKKDKGSAIMPKGKLELKLY